MRSEYHDDSYAVVDQINHELKRNLGDNFCRVNDPSIYIINWFDFSNRILVKFKQYH